MDEGSLDAKERADAAFDGGMTIAWANAKRIVAMDVHKLATVFFPNAKAVTHDEPFKRFSAQEAIQCLREYDDIMRRSNAQKFVEVFGFAHGHEILDDGREVYPSLNDEFWNAEYKAPPEGDNNA